MTERQPLLEDAEATELPPTGFHESLPDPDSVAFTLGWDYGVHRLNLPETAGTNSAFEKGRLQGLQKHALEDSVFVRKWLQVRFNAWTRRRFVHPDFTPEYIAQIAKPKCPVALIALTIGTLEDTDWSVDRLNNNGAYARGNLAVLSTRVNRAKGRLGYDDVCARADGTFLDESLHTMEWARLASVMEGPCSAGGSQVRPMPFLVVAPDTLISDNHKLQMLVLSTVLQPDEQPSRRDLLALLSSPARESWMRLRRKLERKMASNMGFPGEAFRATSVWDAYQKWLTVLSDSELKAAVELVDSTLTPRSSDDRSYVGTFALATRGFLN
jgi:hypothetical protein